MNWNDILLEIMRHHRGKAAGLCLGLILGLLIVIFGFWKTIFVSACIVAGYIIGRQVDENDDFKRALKKFMGKD